MANERELATFAEAIKTLSSEVGGLRGDFKEVMTTQAKQGVEIAEIKKDVGVAHTRITTVSTRQWAFATAVILMVIAGVVKAGTIEGGTELDNGIVTQLFNGDWKSIIVYVGVAILNIGIVAGARSLAMAKGKEFLSSGRAAWIFVFIVCLLEKLLTGHFGQLGDPAGLVGAIQQSIADASAATVGVLAVHTTGKTAIQGVLRATTVQPTNYIPSGTSSSFSMQAASLTLPADAKTIIDVLNALPVDARDDIARKLANVNQYTSVEGIRMALYAAVNKIPTKWGALGVILFNLLVRPKLYRLIDKYLDTSNLPTAAAISSELSGLLGGLVV